MNCVRCNKTLTGNQRKYCDDVCKWKYKSVHQQEAKYLPPLKYRNKNYFYMVVGSEPVRSQGQGKRVNGMVIGSMSAMIESTITEMALVNEENLKRHFQGIDGYTPQYITNGLGISFDKEGILLEYGIKID